MNRPGYESSGYESSGMNRPVMNRPNTDLSSLVALKDEEDWQGTKVDESKEI